MTPTGFSGKLPGLKKPSTLMSRDERWVKQELEDGFDFNPCLGTHGNAYVKKALLLSFCSLIHLADLVM